MGDLQRIEEHAVYTATEAAALLRIGESAMYRLLKDGKLVATKTQKDRGYWRILGGNILNYLREDINKH